jgi:hypothetical protein
MDEAEAFLSRWSRLKREAQEETGAPPENATDQDAAGQEAANDTGRPSATAPPSIDLSALPPIEAITATTDIRPFLAFGVPVELARAALRRAWVADPKIRDFIGIAENQWDFTAPETIPGFGPLKTIDDVRRLVADVMGGSEPVDAEAASAPPRTSGDSTQPLHMDGSAPAPPEGIQKLVSVAPADQAVGIDLHETERNSGIVQHSVDCGGVNERNDHDESVSPARPRRHGGAMPE